MPFKGINWKEEFPKVLAMGKEGKSLQEIGDHYKVSRERIRQIYQKFGIDPRDVGLNLRHRATREDKARKYWDKWGNTDQELYDEKRTKYRAKKANASRVGVPFTILFSELDFPTHCPVLGIELDYFAEGRQENSVSFDRLDSSKGYIAGNVLVVSWRANRIKNDGTIEEHKKIVDFYENL